MKARSAKQKPAAAPSGLEALVVGGGSFGTALATLLARNHRKVRLWVRREEQALEINRRHTNKAYFPELKLPQNLEATTDLAGSLEGVPFVLIAVPSKGFRDVARRVGDHLTGDQVLVHSTKGIEPGTFKRMSEVLREETCALKIGVISGPSLSEELMAGNPAGATVASHYEEVVKKAQALFAGGPFRLYAGNDVIGTEIGGAFKNIIALMSGAAHGLGFGDNTKALIVTRGLYEMTLYGCALGADPVTFTGLAGIGDLMATCSSTLSRNFRTGMRFARGEKLEDILQSSGQVVEGVSATRSVHEQSKILGLDLPMVRAVHAAFFEGRKVQDLLHHLMERPPGRENGRAKGSF